MPTLLIISQVYVPDPTAVGQHMHDAARAMVQRGYRVKVYTARRGYEDPSKKYPRRETRDGVEIIRLPLSSFGKASIPIRLLGGILFVLQATFRGLFTRNLDAILITTSPPMASMAALVIRLFRRRARITFWAMDINPDQMIAMGKIAASALPVRALDWLNRLILRRADAVVALDQFMAETLERKVPARASQRSAALCSAKPLRIAESQSSTPGTPGIADRMHIIPPWPHNEQIESIRHEDNPFRREHGLKDKFVIMYSGNISPAHPLDTILQAAEQLRDEPKLLFLFIGGGLVKQQIEAFAESRSLTNIKTLPYQPLDQIKYSLSAADVHLVAMGNAMVGIVHPCKGYGALAAARPLLLLGPKESHIGQIIDHYDVGWQVDHDDVAGAVKTVRQIIHENPDRLAVLQRNALKSVETAFNKQALVDQFCQIIESGRA